MTYILYEQGTTLRVDVRVIYKYITWNLIMKIHGYIKKELYNLIQTIKDMKGNNNEYYVQSLISIMIT